MEFCRRGILFFLLLLSFFLVYGKSVKPICYDGHLSIFFSLACLPFVHSHPSTNLQNSISSTNLMVSDALFIVLYLNIVQIIKIYFLTVLIPISLVAADEALRPLNSLNQMHQTTAISLQTRGRNPIVLHRLFPRSATCWWEMFFGLQVCLMGDELKQPCGRLMGNLLCIVNIDAGFWTKW